MEYFITHLIFTQKQHLLNGLSLLLGHIFSDLLAEAAIQDEESLMHLQEVQQKEVDQLFPCGSCDPVEESQSTTNDTPAPEVPACAGRPARDRRPQRL